MPCDTSLHPARSQLTRATAIGSRFWEAATPLLTALALRRGAIRARFGWAPGFPCPLRRGNRARNWPGGFQLAVIAAGFATAESTAKVDSRLPTVIRAPPSA